MMIGGVMNQLFINTTMKFIQNNSHHSQEDLNKIQYGLEGVYLTLSKTIIILLIGVLFHYLDTVLLTLLFFNVLRFFAFGLHAKKSIHCLILSIFNFNILPYLFLNIQINKTIVTVIFLFTLASFLLFAPSDTVKRPLTNKRKRIIRKILSIISVVLLLFLIYYFSIFKVSILCAWIVESIMINPISYRLLGLPYNNYKNKA